MPIIIIASNLKDEEKEIAERIANAKGYPLVGPQILPEIETKYRIDEGQLNECLENIPSFIEKFVSNKWKYQLACLEAEVLDRLQTENAVCWGLSAHSFLVGVSHALSVRITHNNAKHAEQIAQQRQWSAQKAKKWLDTELGRQKKWSMTAFNRDETDLSNYDLVINLDQIDLDEAVVSIISAASYRKFQPITYSIKCMSDLALAAKVRTTLLKSMDDVHVQAKDGTILVYTKVFKQKKIEKIKEIKKLAGQINGVSYVEVHVAKGIFSDAAPAVADN